MVLLTILGKNRVVWFSFLLQEGPASKLEKLSQCLVNSFESPCEWQFHGWVPRQPVPMLWRSLLTNTFLASAHGHCLPSKFLLTKPVGAGRAQVDPPRSLQPCTHYLVSAFHVFSSLHSVSPGLPSDMIPADFRVRCYIMATCATRCSF